MTFYFNHFLCFNSIPFLKQSKILEQLFVIYFNILKKNPNFKLIPSVLEGLAKWDI